MRIFEINVLAVIAAVIAGGVLGALWYSPVLFLRPWAKAAGREPWQNPTAYAITFGSALVSVIALAYLLGPRPTLQFGLVQGLIVGACFAAASLGINYAFAARGLTLWLIDAGFHVARFTLFGLVLGLWP